MGVVLRVGQVLLRDVGDIDHRLRGQQTQHAERLGAGVRFAADVLTRGATIAQKGKNRFGGVEQFLVVLARLGGFPQTLDPLFQRLQIGEGEFGVDRFRSASGSTLFST